jgi:uncharacterized membrane protein
MPPQWVGILEKKKTLTYLQHKGMEGLTRYIDIYRDDSVTATDYRIRIVIVSTSICTTAHRDNPARMRHLIVNLKNTR